MRPKGKAKAATRRGAADPAVANERDSSYYSDYSSYSTNSAPARLGSDCQRGQNARSSRPPRGRPDREQYDAARGQRDRHRHHRTSRSRSRPRSPGAGVSGSARGVRDLVNRRPIGARLDSERGGRDDRGTKGGRRGRGAGKGKGRRHRDGGPRATSASGQVDRAEGDDSAPRPRRRIVMRRDREREVGGDRRHRRPEAVERRKALRQAILLKKHELKKAEAARSILPLCKKNLHQIPLQRYTSHGKPPRFRDEVKCRFTPCHSRLTLLYEFSPHMEPCGLPLFSSGLLLARWT